MEKINCTLEVQEYTRKDGSKGKGVLLTTPKGTEVTLGSFALNSKLVYKLVCELEGK